MRPHYLLTSPSRPSACQWHRPSLKTLQYTSTDAYLPLQSESIYLVACQYNCDGRNVFIGRLLLSIKFAMCITAVDLKCTMGFQQKLKQSYKETMKECKETAISLCAWSKQGSVQNQYAWNFKCYPSPLKFPQCNAGRNKMSVRQSSGRTRTRVRWQSRKLSHCHYLCPVSPVELQNKPSRILRLTITEKAPILWFMFSMES